LDEVEDQFNLWLENSINADVTECRVRKEALEVRMDIIVDKFKDITDCYDYLYTETFWNNSTSTYLLTRECNPDFVDSGGDNCTVYATVNDWSNSSYCEDFTAEFFLDYKVKYGRVYETGANCPQCGFCPTEDLYDVDQMGRSQSKGKN